ncbi:MAG: type II secretion system protein [Clostridiales bacterium]|nr:type II secretion system protein [Clostridiales bacterium]
MRNNRGITLIELITVLAIIGLILAVVSPSIKPPAEKVKLKTEAERIVQDIRLTQQLAITTGMDYCFEIHIYEKYYNIRPKTPIATDGVYKKEYLDKSLHTIKCNFASPYTGRYAGLKVLTYTPTGIPSQTGSIELYNRNGDKMTIRVAVGTGRVRIQ